MGLSEGGRPVLNRAIRVSYRYVSDFIDHFLTNRAAFL